MPEEEAFCVFVKLMQDYRLRELFKPSMAELGLCMYQFEFMIQVDTSYLVVRLPRRVMTVWQDSGNDVNLWFSPRRNSSLSCTCISRLRAFTPPCMPPPGSSPSSSPPSLCPSPQGSLISSCVRSVKRNFAYASIYLFGLHYTLVLIFYKKFSQGFVFFYFHLFLKFVIWQLNTVPLLLLVYVTVANGFRQIV